MLDHELDDARRLCLLLALMGKDWDGRPIQARAVERPIALLRLQQAAEVGEADSAGLVPEDGDFDLEVGALGWDLLECRAIGELHEEVVLVRRGHIGVLRSSQHRNGITTWVKALVPVCPCTRLHDQAKGSHE